MVSVSTGGLYAKDYMQDVITSIERALRHRIVGNAAFYGRGWVVRVL